MNKDQLKAQAEALLNEKLSDEQLDGVAGGSFRENQDIFIAMMGVCTSFPASRFRISNSSAA